MRIAIIEDSVFMRRVTTMTVARLYPEAELFEFADAGEALEVVRVHAPIKAFPDVPPRKQNIASGLDGGAQATKNGSLPWPKTQTRQPILF